jgi:hypothetical protein
MSEVTGPPKEPPSFNPNGPLGLQDYKLFDNILKEAGFEFTEQHNMLDEYNDASIGPYEGDKGFKTGMLPVWDTLNDLKTSGKIPDAWIKARSGWDKVGKSFLDSKGNVTFSGVMRFAIVSKPAK